MEAGTIRKATASSALRHPMAIQIVVAANDQPVSPSRFVEEVMQPRPADYSEEKRALSHVAYHFRALAKAGCLEVVESIPRRGAVEHVYAGTARATFDTEEWAELPQEERCKISTATLQALIARVENAMLTHTFDSRDDRWLAWTAAKLDERGWAEMTTTIAANFAELERIREESEARLTETEGESIPATFAMLGFESPSTTRP
ncbi:MAG: hypothetical protein JST53_00855 [Actinobacteria bacterium]|nr:hypothetical protein [Actinomycetota bacterium]